MDKSAICLSVEAIAGTTKEQVARAILRLSKQLNIMVQSEHRGVAMLAIPTKTYATILADYAVEERWLKTLKRRRRNARLGERG